jgi:tetratricopeptide (TPR) repeat protein
MTLASAAMLREQAIAAAQAGDTGRAAALFDKAVAAAPFNASILNSAASHLSRSGNTARAIELLERAVAADPDGAEPLLNLAILLTGAGQQSRALDLLRPRRPALAANARYWSVLASAERAAGLRREALTSYERAAALNPANPRAVEGRARLALETGLDARDAYRAALQVVPGEATALLGYGQALEAAGETRDALALGERLVQQMPRWVDVLEWFAQLRWAAGERQEFTRHYEAAAQRTQSQEVYASWSRMLAGVDQFHDAADVAARGRAALGNPPLLALVEAIHAGEAGDDDRAEQIFRGLKLESPDRSVHEARHRLRTGEPERAELLTARAIEHIPGHVGAWALRDLAWRLLEDPRHNWLHGQPGLVAAMQLDLDEQQLVAAVDFLDRLHDGSSMPVGQSVREGSQTRGGLFDRHEEEVRAIEQSFGRAVEQYRAALPERDEGHPLLRYRDSEWRFAGSWSVRVFSGGRHNEHIHPEGLLSSAAYFVVPAAGAQADPHAGWLELGRPPPDLRLDLPPLFAIEPLRGRCALFPSTLYHGTRRFSQGKRMTVAVDVQASRQ